MQATIKIRKLTGAEIPEPLQRLDENAPKVLYVRGELPAADQLPVAIVGTRRPTAYGRRTTAQLAARLAAAGLPIVSGLAFGIDTAAHRAALDAGGRTIAVLPGGVDRESISPSSNLAVADRIVEQGGAVVSEWPAGTAPHKHHYTFRNRLISGWARAVVVIEAAKPSGSLTTAQHAADQNKDLWAVPGPIDSPVSAGTNHLLTESVSPLISVSHFLEALGVADPGRAAAADGLLGEFSDRPLHADALATRLKRPVADLETELTRLELRGLIKRLEGRYYVRA